MKKKIAVIGINADGSADIWHTEVKVTKQEIKESQDLEKAMVAAEESDFSAKLAISLDEVDFLLTRLSAGAPEQVLEWLRKLEGNGIVIENEQLVIDHLTF